MITFKQVKEKGYVWDGSGIDNPNDWLWGTTELTDIYFPMTTIENKTMDYQLKELKGLREELDRVIEEKKNKVRVLCYKLREECDKEVRDFFHKTFKGKYEWDGYNLETKGQINL